MTDFIFSLIIGHLWISLFLSIFIILATIFYFEIFIKIGMYSSGETQQDIDKIVKLIGEDNIFVKLKDRIIIGLKLSILCFIPIVNIIVFYIIVNYILKGKKGLFVEELREEALQKQQNNNLNNTNNINSSSNFKFDIKEFNEDDYKEI